MSLKAMKILPLVLNDLKMDEEADGDEGTLKGYASTFGNEDLVGDIVVEGAFKKTLKETKGKVPILSNHNFYKQIGWNLAAEEDEKGLKVEGWLDIKTNAQAREHHSLMKKAKEIGAKPGLSIGYRIMKAEPKTMGEGNRTRHVYLLQELKLLEYSPVTFPANPKATVSTVKSLLDNFNKDFISPAECIEAALEDMKREFEQSEILEALQTAAKKFGAADPIEPLPSEHSITEDQTTELIKRCDGILARLK